MEEIKIYDANLKEIGVMERKEAHNIGAWHITFHCWLVSPSSNSILFQLRSKDKKNYPDMFDISAAGHLLASEKVNDGIREVAEELGIDINYEKLYSLGYRVEVDDQDNGQKNREYQAVYMAKVEKKLDEFRPQVEEVAGLMWMHIPDALALFSNQINSATMTGIVYNGITNQWEQETRIVTVKDFIPRIQHYYLTMAIMGERLLENKYPLALS